MYFYGFRTEDYSCCYWPVKKYQPVCSTVNFYVNQTNFLYLYINFTNKNNTTITNLFNDVHSENRNAEIYFILLLQICTYNERRDH